MSSPSLALVGCGAIADFFHLPALERRPDLLPSLILVDRDLARARALREKLGAADAVADYRDVIGRVQGAIIATPHAFHYPITIDLVRAGVNVLCEKPLAGNAAQVDDIVRTAGEKGVQVAVNHTRRLFSSNREIQRLTTSGALGEVKEIEYELGEPFLWPAATNTFFGVNAGGRGVLYDTGAHIIDLVCWWMGGEPEIVSYEDDSRGGTEAYARITLRRGPTTARVTLSWLSKLRNFYRVTGTKGIVEGGIYDFSSFNRRDAAGGKPRRVRTDKTRSFDDFSDRLLGNFIDVIDGKDKPITSAADARAAIAVIDACYARRSLMSEPWHDACKDLVNV